MIRCNTFSLGLQSFFLHVYACACHSLSSSLKGPYIWLYYIPISLWAAAQCKTELLWQVNGIEWIRLRLHSPPLRWSLWQVAVDIKSLWYFHDWLTAWNCSHHLDSIVIHLACGLSLKCRKLDSSSSLGFQPYTVWQENRLLFFCTGGGGQVQNERVWEKVSGSITDIMFLRRDSSDALKSYQFPLTTCPIPPTLLFSRLCRTLQWMTSFARAQPAADT